MLLAAIPSVRTDTTPFCCSCQVLKGGKQTSAMSAPDTFVSPGGGTSTGACLSQMGQSWLYCIQPSHLFICGVPFPLVPLFLDGPKFLCGNLLPLTTLEIRTHTYLRVSPLHATTLCGEDEGHNPMCCVNCGKCMLVSPAAPSHSCASS